jgi:undecaprenyl-diphosphatase
MDVVQAIILGIVQGLTEFIPVSSSGHLVLVPAVLGWSPPGLAFDTMLHLGTALALIVFFWREWATLIVAGVRSVFRWRIESADERLAWLIIVGCIPAALAGYLLEDFFARVFEDPIVSAYFLIVTAGILTVAEGLGRRLRSMEKLRLSDAVAIGVAQAVAIFPGISRSGSTIAAGLLVGLERESAARFSFLLAAPIILGAGLLQLPQAVRTRAEGAGSLELALGFAAAAIVGYLCIGFLLRYLRRGGLYPFAAYCFVAGIVAVIRLGGFGG